MGLHCELRAAKPATRICRQVTTASEALAVAALCTVERLPPLKESTCSAPAPPIEASTSVVRASASAMRAFMTFSGKMDFESPLLTDVIRPNKPKSLASFVIILRTYIAWLARPGFLDSDLGIGVAR